MNSFLYCLPSPPPPMLFSAFRCWCLTLQVIPKKLIRRLALLSRTHHQPMTLWFRMHQTENRLLVGRSSYVHSTKTILAGMLWNEWILAPEVAWQCAALLKHTVFTVRYPFKPLFVVTHHAQVINLDTGLTYRCTIGLVTVVACRTGTKRMTWKSSITTIVFYWGVIPMLWPFWSRSRSSGSETADTRRQQRVLGI